MKNNAIIISVLAIILLVFTTCKKTPEVTDINNKIELSTLSTDNITSTSATSGGDVTNDGNSAITARGICWNATGNPSLENNLGYTSDGSGTGSFTSDITGLINNSIYYVVAYATNERGTAYGRVQSFKTLEIIIAVVATITPSNIQSNSAISGGDITNDGNGAITARGVCWNTTTNPSLENNIGYTSDGSGTGDFTSNITGLTENTTYYVAAYAINKKGTAYGQIKNFTTEISCGQLTINYGGQLYHTVQIGTQCWMEENLNIGTRINGSQEMQANSSIEKYCYDDSEENCDTYGGLYQWNELMQYATQEGVQGICPDGWHIPTDNEWKQMEMYLGMSQSEADNEGPRGTDEGRKLKSTSGWNYDGNGTNSSGFSALPWSARYSDGEFGSLGISGYWWSSTEGSDSVSWSRRLSNSNDQVFRWDYPKTYGYSVRCLKN
ncbi:MAG: hypothetical protein B7C24_15050 [Bacteroidetes bacterium 4572_77]|nr:MAG: hypothetical protein B7C24_15050 [Bacteroidetes bacterium 4572_77]